MKHHGLKILLEHGHFLIVAMPPDKCKLVMGAWLSDDPPAHVQGQCSATGSVYCFRTSRVMAMHTVDGIETTPTAQQGPRRNIDVGCLGGGSKLSGVN